jgi:anti-sigma factor RsiW
MLTRKELTELVTDHAEGGLSFTKELSFRRHLAMCKHCRAYVRQVSWTIRTLGRLPAEPMPTNVRDELLARFRKMQPRTCGRNPVPVSVRLLAAIERVLGGQRAWLAGGAVLGAQRWS